MTIIYGRSALVLPGATGAGINALIETMQHAIKRHEEAGRPASKA